MTIKEELIEANVLDIKYVDEFLEKYKDVTDIFNLKNIARGFQKRKRKEKKAEDDEKKLLKFKELFPTLSFSKGFLSRVNELIKTKNLNPNKILEDFCERTKYLISNIPLDIYKQYKYVYYFKNDELYNKSLKKLFKATTIFDLEKEAKLLKDEIENKKSEYENKYNIRIKRLNEIIKPDSIEKHYPKARRKTRNIIAYLGPTNSGKTHKAIEKLKESKTGIYLAPLRLLAREIYDDLKAYGIKVSLITGEEKIIDEEATHVCSTIEMLDLNERYDLALIDEIQFLADKNRGNAWTRALLGVNTKNIIVMGSTDTEDALLEIVNMCKDKIEIVKFNRLSPLEFHKVGAIKKDQLEKGDAIIAFSRRDVHRLAAEITNEHNKKVSVIYGALPPEVRIEESRRFNEGESEILVATDAIGFGLNLNIKRVIFSTIEKFDGTSMNYLQQTIFNQISGRAGRYGKFDKGEVYFLSGNRNPYNFGKYSELAFNFEKPLPTLKKVYYFPEYIALKELSELTGNKESMARLLAEYSLTFKNPLFKFRYDFLATLWFLDSLPIDLELKYNLMFAPVKESNFELYKKYVNCVLNKKVSIFNFDNKVKNSRELYTLESASSEALLYMWMSNKYPKIFPDYEEVQEYYNKVSEIMIKVLKSGH